MLLFLRINLPIKKKVLNDLEQYGRRQCIRLEGCNTVHNERSEDVLKAVKGFGDSVGANIPDLAFDRAHRIGKPYKVDNIEKQSIIVRFSTFRHRSIFYYKRKEIFDKFGVWVRLDLTKYNYDVLKEAREFVKNMENVDYVYADINCRCKVKFINKDELFFNNLNELKALLA